MLPHVLQEVPGNLLEQQLDVGSLLARCLEQLRPDLAAVGLGGGELHGAVLVEGAASDVLSTLPAALRTRKGLKNHHDQLLIIITNCCWTFLLTWSRSTLVAAT